MRIAHFDCAMGISGDMVLGALLDAGVSEEALRRGLSSLPLEGVELRMTPVIKGGFRAVKVDVEHPEQHAHRHLSDVVRLIDAASELTDRQRELAKRIFHEVATAEATVHGSTLEKVHFHEVGAIDSIVDIVGAAIGFDLLGADQVTATAVPPGRGSVSIDHGICPLPAPGTAELLKGIPLIDVPVEAELTTPTGAAILRVVADRFGPLPEMTIERIGYGAGTRDFPGRANLLRVFVGEAAVSSESDVVCLLETNLDDVTGEVVGHTREMLAGGGALDVWTVPVQMKKERPGVVLTALCNPADAEALESILFTETGTFGVRRSLLQRSKRARKPHSVETPWGSVEGKLGWRRGEAAVFTPEFESCAQAARDHNVPLREVYRAAESAFAAGEAPAAVAKPPEPAHHHDHDHG